MTDEEKHSEETFRDKRGVLRTKGGQIVEKPDYFVPKRKGAQTKVYREIRILLHDQGIPFMKKLFQKAEQDLDGDERHSERVRLAAAFMLKAMPSLKSVFLDVDAEIKGGWALFQQFNRWTPEDKQNFVETGKLPPEPQYAEEGD